MKYEVYKVLDYSRHFIGDLIELHDCSHHGYFDKYDSLCVNCEQRFECQWLNQDRNFLPDRNMPASEVMKTLEFAIHYVDAWLSAQEHDLVVCRCEGCSWLRCAECLFEQLRESRLRG